VVEDLAKKEEHIREILEKESKLITYSGWLNEERARHPDSSIRPREGTFEDPQSGILPQVNRSRTQAFTVKSQTSSNRLSRSKTSAPAFLSSLKRMVSAVECWETDCAVCLGEFELEEMVRELPCDHIFHNDCILNWFIKAKSPACPLCRSILAEPSQDPQTEPAATSIPPLASAV
jgi:hypothetical protein